MNEEIFYCSSPVMQSIHIPYACVQTLTRRSLSQVELIAERVKLWNNTYFIVGYKLRRDLHAKVNEYHILYYLSVILHICAYLAYSDRFLKCAVLLKRLSRQRKHSQ